MAHGSSNKAKARRSHKKAGYYKEQFFRTAANKARQKKKREAKAAKWKEIKAKAGQAATRSIIDLHKRAKRLAKSLRHIGQCNVFHARNALQLDEIVARTPSLEYLTVLG